MAYMGKFTSRKLSLGMTWQRYREAIRVAPAAQKPRATLIWPYGQRTKGMPAFKVAALFPGEVLWCLKNLARSRWLKENRAELLRMLRESAAKGSL